MPEEIRWLKRRIWDRLTAIPVGHTVWIKKIKDHVCVWVSVWVWNVGVWLTQLLASASPVKHAYFLEWVSLFFPPKNLLSDGAFHETLDKCFYSHSSKEHLWHCPCSSPLQMLLISPNTWPAAGCVCRDCVNRALQHITPTVLRN